MGSELIGFIIRKGWNIMELRANIIGYHVNDKDRCEKFVNNDEYIIFSNDTCWLGYGMYFWDNQANAKYWINQKKRKEKDIQYIGQVQANIFIDKLLDLTDEDVLDTFNVLWEQYCSKARINKNQPIGIKIDRLFDFFKLIEDSFKVIRVFGKYENSIERDFLTYQTKKDSSSAKPTNKIKMVYCVRSYEYVCNRTLEGVFKNEFYRCN